MVPRGEKWGHDKSGEPWYLGEKWGHKCRVSPARRTMVPRGEVGAR